MKPFTYRNKTVMVARTGNIYYGRKKVNQYNNGRGYMSVSISSKLFYVHRIVCEVYHGKPQNNKMQANHLNGIRWDNRSANLRWDTVSDNQKHAYKELNRVHSKGQKGKSGEKHHKSIRVDQINLFTGDIVKTYSSIREAARCLNVHHSNILAVIQGRRNTSKGFKWAYNSVANNYKPKYIYFYLNDIKKRKLNIE